MSKSTSLLQLSMPLLVFGMGMALAFISCQSGVTDAEFTATASAEQVSSETLEADTAGNPLKVEFVDEGTGTSDLLGDFSVQVAGVTDLVAQTTTAKITVVTAPGDTIFLDGKAQGSEDGSFTAEETITGGTGKYAKASGSSTTTGNGNQQTGASSWETKGTISY